MNYFACVRAQPGGKPKAERWKDSNSFSVFTLFNAFLSFSVSSKSQPIKPCVPLCATYYKSACGNAFSRNRRQGSTQRLTRKAKRQESEAVEASLAGELIPCRIFSFWRAENGLQRRVEAEKGFSYKVSVSERRFRLAGEMSLYEIHLTHIIHLACIFQKPR